MRLSLEPDGDYSLKLGWSKVAPTDEAAVRFELLGPGAAARPMITDEQLAQIWRAVAIDYGVPLDILMGGSGNVAVTEASRSELKARLAHRLTVSRATLGAGKEVHAITSQEDADRVFGKGEVNFEAITRHLPKGGPTVIRYEPDSEDGR
jgi:hypothetical protein